MRIYLDPCEVLNDSMTQRVCLEISWCRRFASEMFLLPSPMTERLVLCVAAENTHTHAVNVEVWAELKQLRCTWFKSRSPHLFLMLEQLADEISGCVFSPPARSDCLAPRKSHQRSSIEQIYTQLSQIYFCLFVVFKWNWRAGGERRADSNTW